MSVANVYVGPDCALILSDTLQYKGRRPAGLCATKTHVTPDGRMAWTFRGGARVEEIMAPFIEAHSDAREAAPALAAHADDCMPARGVPGGFELTLVSWSDGPAAFRVKRREGEPRTAIEELGPGVHLLPAPKAVALPETADEALMIRLAMAQWKAQQAFDLPLCIGGVMHLTEVTGAGIAQRVVGEYPDHALMARRFGCPNENWSAANAA